MAKKENYTREEVEQLLERQLEELGPEPKLPPVWVALLVIGIACVALYALAYTV